MGKHLQSIDSNIISRVMAAGPGQVFTPRQFLDLGSRDAVDKALSRHCTAGTLRRLARGLYDLPRTHTRFGTLPATSDAIAKAADDQREACRAVEARIHLRAASIEKDFWVCWTLRELFNWTRCRSGQLPVSI